MAKRKLQYVFGADTREVDKAFISVGKRLERTGKQVEAISKNMMKLASPMIAIGGYAAKIALNYDDAMDTIAIKTGATGTALKGLENDFKALNTSAPVSMEQVADVIGDLNTRLGLTGPQLQSMGSAMIDAARMNKEEIGAMMTESTKAMNDWGVKASDGVRFMDMLFTASQQTGISIANLSTQLYKYGTPLRQLGFDTESTIATLSAFEKAGVNTELVMGSLRKALNTMAKNGIDLRGGLAGAIEQIKNTESSSKAAAMAAELFGAKAGADMAGAIREGRFEVEGLTTALLNADGQIKRTAASTDGFAEQCAQIARLTTWLQLLQS